MWTSEYQVTFVIEAESINDLPDFLSQALADGLPKEWFIFNDEVAGITDWRVAQIFQPRRRTHSKWYAS